MCGNNSFGPSKCNLICFSVSENISHGWDFFLLKSFVNPWGWEQELMGELFQHPEEGEQNRHSGWDLVALCNGCLILLWGCSSCAVALVAISSPSLWVRLTSKLGLEKAAWFSPCLLQLDVVLLPVIVCFHKTIWVCLNPYKLFDLLTCCNS